MGFHHADADDVHLTDEVLLARLRNDLLGGSVLVLAPEVRRHHRIGRGEARLDGLVVVAKDFGHLISGERSQLGTGDLLAAQFDAVPVQPAAHAGERHEGAGEQAGDAGDEQPHQLPPSGHFRS